ncbi:molybdopterin molybdotransferase MoeA [Methanoregula sp. PtaB.Bin085]|uniref:molybdopterin molybdotransferase MoeA n=1 Tax=Methanoregula sp. PtaB.Bin085 TaxID=1811680 RepID=UPI0009CF0AD3|nr:molybdopterin molybdotransferase MoeA [Methanoregula sp. PtaB.Bin085]OPX62321.1 MAG: molybdopterin biosynthesis protein MoeA [Methanoregula sp. PtaB.Bin085]
MKKLSLGLTEALTITLENCRPLGMETIALADSTDRIAASDLHALVDSPSADSSLKDGYAVRSREICNATQENPVRLRLAGRMAPGGTTTVDVEPGMTVRVLTGAKIPSGADAVLTEEFTRPDGSDVLAMNVAEPGRNILFRGEDVESRSRIVEKGRQISPGLLGLIAAAGHSTVPVFRTPTVAIIGTGDEIVLPGETLAEGKLYASNILTINAWCRRYRMKTVLTVVNDDINTLTETFRMLSADADALITSGGAWTGDRDFTAQVLEGLGWHQYFHRIRIGPGKAVGFGMLCTKPVFILPGGPSSNLMGFLQIALPGLLALAGHAETDLPRINARLATDLEGRQRDWTNFFFGRLEDGGEFPIFHSLKDSSRLRAIADADAIACIAEGQGVLAKGSVVPVQVLK